MRVPSVDAGVAAAVAFAKMPVEAAVAPKPARTPAFGAVAPSDRVGAAVAPKFNVAAVDFGAKKPVAAPPNVAVVVVAGAAKGLVTVDVMCN